MRNLDNGSKSNFQAATAEDQWLCRTPSPGAERAKLCDRSPEVALCFEGVLLETGDMHRYWGWNIGDPRHNQYKYRWIF